MSREYTYHVVIADGNTVDISDEPAGYDRFIEVYAYYGDVKVEIYPFQFGKGRDEQPLLETTKLSELMHEYDLINIRELKKLQKDLTTTDKHILKNLGLDWMPTTTYKELENEKFKRPELEKSMAKLRKLDLVDYYSGEGFNLTRAGMLILDESITKASGAA